LVDWPQKDRPIRHHPENLTYVALEEIPKALVQHRAAKNSVCLGITQSDDPSCAQQASEPCSTVSASEPPIEANEVPDFGADKSGDIITRVEGDRSPDAVTSAPITSLRPHENNIQIYGDPDSDLTESIHEKGILAPLLITPDNRIISGHRRWIAAKQAGLEQVPVIYIETDDESENLEILIHTNKQRNKTNEQIGREYLVLKRIIHERESSFSSVNNC